MNLGLGQSGFDEVFARLGSLIRVWVWMKTKVKSKMDSVRLIGEGANQAQADAVANGVFRAEQGTTFQEVQELYTAVSFYFAGWFLTGIKLGVNTDKKGILYGKWLNADDKLHIYKDSARASEVAVSDAQAGGPVILTISESNDSGITGTVTKIEATANDQFFQLMPQPDWKDRLKNEFNQQTDEDCKVLTVALDRLSSNADTIAGIISDWESLIEDEFIKGYLKQKLQTSRADVLTVTQEQSDGTVTIEYAGILQDLYDAMQDDGTPQTVWKNENEAESFTADPDNTGKGSVALTVLEHARAGFLTLECTDETIGSETFEVRFRPTNWLNYDDQVAANSLYVKKVHRDNVIGISSLQITRTIDETNDGNAVYSNWVISGETADNTNNGILYIKWTQVGAITQVYKDSGLASADLVAQGTGLGAITLTEQNGSGISGSVTVGDQVDDVDIYIHLNPFKEGDIFTSEIHSAGTATYTTDRFPEFFGSYFQKYFGDVYNFSLPSTTRSAATLKEDFVTRG